MNAFASDVQKAQEWLKELTYEGQFNDEKHALAVLRVVLHAVRDRLMPNEAIHLASQLPLILVGVYYTGWDPDKTPTNERNLNDFINKISRNASTLNVDPEDALRATCKFLTKKIDSGELRDVSYNLPSELKNLFMVETT